MKRLGGFLLVLGIGSFILPFFGMQFRILNAVSPRAQPILGAAMALAGLALLLIGALVGRKQPVAWQPTVPRSMPPPLPTVPGAFPGYAPPGPAPAFGPPRMPAMMPVPMPGGMPIPPAMGRRHWPLVALIAALLIPGAGQAYNGQPIKGFFLLFLSALVLPWLYSVYDAWSRARTIAVSGGRFGKGGYVWVFLQGWLAFNVTLLTLIILTTHGVLK
jgi:TM2 domain-containing membrane protein YozV